MPRCSRPALHSLGAGLCLRRRTFGVLSAYFRRTFGVLSAYFLAYLDVWSESAVFLPRFATVCQIHGRGNGGAGSLTRCLHVEVQSWRVWGRTGGPRWGNGRFGGRVWPLSRGLWRGRDRRPKGAKSRGKGRRNGERREFTLSASRVNYCVERSASDRQAPRTRRSSNCSEKVSTDTRCLLFSNTLLP
jgi:hypothetical protein